MAFPRSDVAPAAAAAGDQNPAAQHGLAAGGGNHVDVLSRAVRIAHGLPAVHLREIAAMHSADRLERNTVRGCTQPRDQRHSGVFFELRALALDRFPVPLRESEVAFHRDDACAHASHGACAAEFGPGLIAEDGGVAPRNIPPSRLAAWKLTRVASRPNQPMTSSRPRNVPDSVLASGTTTSTTSSSKDALTRVQSR